MLSLADAQLIVAGGIAHARENLLPPMTIAVLDAAGNLVAFAREDRSSLLREKIARGKAMGALNMGMGSRSLAGRAASHPHFVNALVALADGNMVPVAGGVLIRDGAGEVIGAVGVTGHLPDADEDVAIAGILAANHMPDPGE